MEEIRNLLGASGDNKEVVEELKVQAQALRDIKQHLNIPDTSPSQADQKLQENAQCWKKKSSSSTNEQPL